MKRRRRGFGAVGCFAGESARRYALRLGTIRVATFGFAAAYLLFRGQHFTGVIGLPRSAFEGIGAAAWLGAPMPPGAVWGAWGMAVCGCTAAALGIAYRYSGPLAAALLTWVACYRSSFGMLFHTEHLLCLHALLLATAPAAESLVFRGGVWRLRSRPETRSSRACGIWIYGLSVVTTITYLVAGVAKLKASGWSWAEGDALAAQIAYDALRKAEYGRMYSPLGPIIVQFPWLFPPLAFGTLVLELGAPLVLFHRALGRWFARLAWGFHFGVLLTMFIVFAYPLSFLAYLSFFEPERLLLRWLRGGRLRALQGRFRASTEVSRAP